MEQEAAMPTAQVIRIETRRTARPRRTSQVEPRSDCVIVQLFRTPARVLDTTRVQDDDLRFGHGCDPG